MNYRIKVHSHPNETILAVCDEDILGQTFRGDGLRIKVLENFYGGDIVDEEGLIRAFDSFTVLNIVGNSAVELAVARGIVEPDRVLVIGGVKHAQAVTLR